MYFHMQYQRSCSPRSGHPSRSQCAANNGNRRPESVLGIGYCFIHPQLRPLLIASGAYELIQVLRADPEAAGPLAGQQQQLGRLLVTGIALSIDNLAVGFTLGTYRVSLPVTMASDSTRIR